MTKKMTQKDMDAYCESYKKAFKNKDFDAVTKFLSKLLQIVFTTAILLALAVGIKWLWLVLIS